MHQSNFIVREPLLDPKQGVIGYELAWQQEDGQVPTDADLEALVGFVAGQLNDDEHGWLLRDKVIVMNAVPAMLSTDALFAMPPEHTVLSMHIDELADETTLAAVQGLRAGGVGIALRGADLGTISKTHLAAASYLEVNFTGGDVAAQAQAFSVAKPGAAKLIGRPVGTWTDFDACAALELNAFVGKLHLTPRPGAPVKGLNPAQTIILQLMQMVKQNADIRQLESVLKRDTALSYKLMRYINSVAVSGGRTMQSLRQALGMLGYAPLYRWLTLLLATASTSGYSPVLLETAVVRGRLTEILGMVKLGKLEGENLFVAGMFSLLDRLLGMPMEEVLATIQLAPDVVESLLSRSGKYGPYLALAEACELNSTLVASLADSVGITPLQLNKAHLSALAWAQNLTG